MKGFSRSNTFKILIIVVFINAGILMLSNTLGNAHIATLLGFAIDPMQEVTASLTDEEQAMLSSMSRDELERYYIELYRENSTIRSQLLDYYTVVNENEQYEKLLNISEERPDFTLVNATVIARDSTDAFSSFTINLGYIDGVESGDPVITENGLVGIISEVSALSSKVTTILSEDLSVGVIAMECMESAVLSGDAELAINGNVIVKYLENSTQFNVGTVVSTSGIGEIYPSGILIGEVLYLGSSSTDSSLFAVVSPYVDLETVSDVFVITDYLESYVFEETDEEVSDDEINDEDLNEVEE